MYSKSLNRRRIEQTTDIFFAPQLKARDEVLLRENSNFVGATATFTDTWQIVPRLGSRLPSGYILDACLFVDCRIDPCLAERQEALTKAARCVCYIGTKQDDEYASGTAFFVSPTILLTAGHVVPDTSVGVVAQVPGSQRTETCVNFSTGTWNPQKLKRSAVGSCRTNRITLRISQYWIAQSPPFGPPTGCSWSK